MWHCHAVIKKPGPVTKTCMVVVVVDEKTFEACADARDETDAAAGGHLGLRDEYNRRLDSLTPGMVQGRSNFSDKVFTVDIRCWFCIHKD